MLPYTSKIAAPRKKRVPCSVPQLIFNQRVTYGLVVARLYHTDLAERNPHRAWARTENPPPPPSFRVAQHAAPHLK
jgi:hypothetical protein